MIKDFKKLFQSQYALASLDGDGVLGVKDLKNISDEELIHLFYFMFGWDNIIIRFRSIHSVTLTSEDIEEIRERGETRKDKVKHEMVLLFNHVAILISDTYTTDYSIMYDILRQLNYLTCFSFIDNNNEIVKYSPLDLIEKGWAKYVG